MSVEIWGFLILIVIMVIVIFRRQSIQSKLKERKNLDDSAMQLQLQLEEVADAVIGRMENRIDHLEMLIAEADDKIIRLDEKIKCVASLDEREALRSAEAVVVEPLIPEKQPEVLDAPPQRLLKKKKIVFKTSKANQVVIDLIEAGHSLDEIAKKTGMGKSAILLIQEMYRIQRMEQAE